MNPEQERKVMEALGDLARSEAGLGAPPEVEAAVLTSFRARRRPVMWRTWAAAAAAVLVAVTLWFLPSRPAAQPRAAETEIATEFIPLQRGWVASDSELTQIVRIRLPRGELRRFGLPVSFDSAAESIRADVVIGSDGIARAVRFVQ
jgi:hypothetical protein